MTTNDGREERLRPRNHSYICIHVLQRINTRRAFAIFSPRSPVFSYLFATAGFSVLREFLRRSSSYGRDRAIGRNEKTGRDDLSERAGTTDGEVFPGRKN